MLLDISSPLAYASFDEESKQLTSSVIDIGANTSLIANVNEPEVNGHICFCENYEALMTKLVGLGVKNPDGSDLIGGVL